MYRFRSCSLGLFFEMLLLMMSNSEASHRQPLSYWTTSVGNFPFFEYLANPCDYQRVEAYPLQQLHRFLEQEKSATVFTPRFLEDVYLDINLAVTSLEAVQDVTGDTDSCSSLKLAYNPAHAPVRKFDVGLIFSSFNLMCRRIYQGIMLFHEHQTLVSTYDQGIYLITQLYMSIVDRQIINGTNGIPDSEMTFPLDSMASSSYLTCGSEPPTMLQLIGTLATRLQALLCTVVNGADPVDRSRFSTALQNLRHTPIYRYTSCTDLEARDCILMDSVKEFLRQSTVAFKKSVREHEHRSTGGSGGIRRSGEGFSGFQDGRYKIVMDEGENGIEEVY